MVIFVVDDSKTARAHLAALLTRLGHEPISLSSGEECLAALGQRSPGAVLLDLNMEGMRGDECCRRLKSDPRHATTPVIILTAADASHEVMGVWRAAADDFLPKPVSETALARKLAVLQHAPAASAPPRRDRLLLVDDSAFFRATLGSMFEHAGFHLDYAADLEQAKARVGEHGPAFDAFLFDCLLPRGHTGIELARWLRSDALARAPELAGRPILLMSGSPSSELDAQALETTGRKILDKRLVAHEGIVQHVLSALSRSSPAMRPEPRVPFFSVVEFRPAPGEDWSTGFSYDASAGGIFIRTLTPAEAGSSLEVAVSFRGRRPAPVVRCTVAWSNRYEARRVFSYPVGMGLKIDALPDDEAEQLFKLVKIALR